MMRQESSGKTDSFWNNLWGSEPKDYQNSGIADSKAQKRYTLSALIISKYSLFRSIE
jgi:hypothetical protein